MKMPTHKPRQNHKQPHKHDINKVIDRLTIIFLEPRRDFGRCGATENAYLTRCECGETHSCGQTWLSDGKTLKQCPKCAQESRLRKVKANAKHRKIENLAFVHYATTVRIRSYQHSARPGEDKSWMDIRSGV